MKIRGIKSVWFVCLVLCGLSCRSTTTQTLTPVPTNNQNATPVAKIRADIGFRSKRNLEEHYQKHGREFGSITQAEYLQQAQTLRDSVVSGDILEAVRQDGVTTRFDRKAGTFLAFNPDATIRTYFKPNDGERYFKRQMNRER